METALSRNNLECSFVVHRYQGHGRKASARTGRAPRPQVAAEQSRAVALAGLEYDVLQELAMINAQVFAVSSWQQFGLWLSLKTSRLRARVVGSVD